MKTIKAYQLGADSYAAYVLPSIGDLFVNSRATWGKQWDYIERKYVEGGLPTVIPSIRAVRS